VARPSSAVSADPRGFALDGGLAGVCFGMGEVQRQHSIGISNPAERTASPTESRSLGSRLSKKPA